MKWPRAIDSQSPGTHLIVVPTINIRHLLHLMAWPVGRGQAAGDCGNLSLPKEMACHDHEENTLIQEDSGLAGREKASTAVDSDSSF